MSEYIINPAWFYWVSVFSAIKYLAIGFAIVGFIIAGIAFPLIGSEMCGDDEVAAWKKWLKRTIVALSVSVLLAVLLPSEETMYKMMVAKYITHENVTLSVEAVKNAVDYIVEKLGAL